MHEIKSFNIFQTSKVIAAIYLIIAAVVWLCIAIWTLLHGHPGRAFLELFIPIVYGIVSFVFTAFFCWLYNRIASQLGGIAFELSPYDSSQP